MVLYNSEDLRNWECLSTFGPANATGGVWECPDLFPLPVDGDPDNLQWVLTVNLNPGGPNNGSAGQYFVGDFDGTTFTSATTVTEGLQDPARLGEYQWLDWGRDYYAAVSFSDAPDNRRLMIAWMNNWEYANQIPTSPWRSPMSLAREISLHTIDGDPAWSKRPPAISPQGFPRPGQSFSLADDRNSRRHSTSWKMPRAASSASRSPSPREQPRNSGWSSAATEPTEPESASDRPKEPSIVDRRALREHRLPRILPLHRQRPRPDHWKGPTISPIYVDRCSVEVFAQGGQVTMTELIFPAATSTDVAVYAIGGAATAKELRVTGYA